MDCQKTGELIHSMRKEKNMTQLQLANLLNVSDKTISKWERGLGCPDISLLQKIAQVFAIDIDSILSGTLIINQTRGDCIKRLKIYICDQCNNIIISDGEAGISCCGRTLDTRVPAIAKDSHLPTIARVEDESFITFSHDMRKDHFLSCIIYIGLSGYTFFRLYPEQNPEFRLPMMRGGKLLIYCTKHGLFEFKQ